MDTLSEIDQIMERASEQLAEMDYADCERSCMQALRLSYAGRDWGRFARILLPLQEARRQRRQIAEEAGVIVLTEQADPAAILEKYEAGCLLLLDPPFSQADEAAVRDLARSRGQFVEVLRLDGAGLRAAYLTALEDRGDAALAKLDRTADAETQLENLYAQLDAIGDHEIAHQRLADLARRLSRESD